VRIADLTGSDSNWKGKLMIAWSIQERLSLRC